MKDYDFARLAKAARREEHMRRVVYGKKVERQQMEPEEAQRMTQDMTDIAEVLERLTIWKQQKQATANDTAASVQTT